MTNECTAPGASSMEKLNCVAPPNLFGGERTTHKTESWSKKLSLKHRESFQWPSGLALCPNCPSLAHSTKAILRGWPLNRGEEDCCEYISPCVSELMLGTHSDHNLLHLARNGAVSVYDQSSSCPPNPVCSSWNISKPVGPQIA